MTERPTATAARSSDDQKPARPSAAVNAAKRFCLPHTQQRGLPRSSFRIHRFIGSIAGDHRLLVPFFAGGRVTYRQYLTQARVKVGAGRAPVSSLRGFHASSSGSFVQLEGKEAFLRSRGFVESSVSPLDFISSRARAHLRGHSGRRQREVGSKGTAADVSGAAAI